MIKRIDIEKRLNQYLLMRRLELNTEEYSQACEALSKCQSLSTLNRRMDMVVNSIGIKLLKLLNERKKDILIRGNE